MVSKFILNMIMRIFAKRTKTILDDLIVDSLKLPVMAILIVGGLWIGITRLPEVVKYVDKINTGFIIVSYAIAAFAVSRVTHAILTWYSV